MPKLTQRDALNDDQGISVKDYELLLKKLRKFGERKSFMDTTTRSETRQRKIKEAMDDEIKKIVKRRKKVTE